eukprot:7838494-Pyramimonas_sp.AAC.2
MILLEYLGLSVDEAELVAVVLVLLVRNSKQVAARLGSATSVKVKEFVFCARTHEDLRPACRREAHPVLGEAWLRALEGGGTLDRGGREQRRLLHGDCLHCAGLKRVTITFSVRAQVYTSGLPGQLQCSGSGQNWVLAQVPSTECCTRRKVSEEEPNRQEHNFYLTRFLVLHFQYV